MGSIKMSNSEPLNSSEFLKSSAFLRREFFGRSAFETNGSFNKENTIVFFDTDIIITYCEPWRMGSLRANPRLAYGYGEIFPSRMSSSDTETDVSKANEIASILSEYCLVKSKSLKMPVYQFDEHFSETTRIYDNAEIFARHENPRQSIPENQLNERLRRAGALIAMAPLSDQRSDQKLLPLVKYVLEQLAGTVGYPKKLKEQRLLAWERFVRLNALSGGIYPAKYAPEHLGKDAPLEVVNALGILKNGPTGAEQIIFDKLSQIFVHRMGAPRAKKTADAKALAMLYLLNSRLKALGWRAIFITGTKTIIEACYDDIPLFEGADTAVSNGFSEQFVRHFWAYTSEALIEPDLHGRQKFINWLDGLLANWSDAQRFNVAALTRLVRNGRLDNGLDQSEVEEASAEWESLTDDAVSRHMFEAFGLDSVSALKLQSRILSKIASMRDGGRIQGWSVTLEDLKEEYHRAKDRSFLELSGIGKAAIWRTSGLGQRNPPDLGFGSLEKTNSIFRKLCHPAGYKPDEFVEDFASIKEDCHDSTHDNDDRQESHLKFLVLGAAFAGANKWGVALSQGKRAASIFERSRGTRYWPIPVKSSDTYMSGREAYFLCAAAMRMVSQSLVDLDRAKDYLMKSEEALEEDWSQGTAKRTTRVRLRGEDLALELSRYYIERQKDEENFCDDMVPNIYSAAQALLDEISSVEPNGLGFSGGGIFRKNFGKVTLVNVATNLVQVAVIRAFRKLHKRPEPTIFPVAEENLAFSVDLMNYFTAEKEDSPHSVKETALVGMYRDAGARLLGDEISGYYKTLEGRTSLYQGKQDMYVAVYDTWRFRKLAELADQLNNMSIDKRKMLLFS